MKVVRFDRLLASTALGLVIVLSGQTANAQQPQGQQDQQLQIVAPEPNDAKPAPKESSAGINAPAMSEPKLSEPKLSETKVSEPKVAEPEKAAAAPAVTEPEKAAVAPSIAEPKRPNPRRPPQRRQ